MIKTNGAKWRGKTVTFSTLRGEVLIGTVASYHVGQLAIDTPDGRRLHIWESDARIVRPSTMQNRTGHTPKTLAMSIAIDLIRDAYNGGFRKTFEDETPAFQRETRRQLAKLHNKLLTQSGLDGIALDEEPPIQL